MNRIARGARALNLAGGGRTQRKSGPGAACERRR